MYWANQTRYPIMADIVSQKRYQKLRDFFYVSDDSEKEKPENINNRLFKIQPVLDHVRNNCILIDPEREHSIIPAKTKYSEIHQCNPKNLKKKTKKMGF